MELGGSGSVMEEQNLLKNSALHNFFNQLLDERINEVNEKGESSGLTLLSTISPQGKSNITKGNNQSNVMKSPSDTTIYAPAFAKRPSNLKRLMSKCHFL